MTNPKPNLKDFRFELPIQMRWNDLDPLGHVNNAIFITYFEFGRSQYMLKASSIWDWTKNMFLIGDVQAAFHKEAMYMAVLCEAAVYKAVTRLSFAMLWFARLTFTMLSFFVFVTK